MSDPILVTGVGAVSALGTGRSETWRRFAAGESGIRVLADGDDRLERGVDVSPPPNAGLAGWVRGFRPREHVQSPQLRRMDWCSRMLVAAVRQAFDDAGLLPLDPDASPRTALVVGSCYGNQRETAQYLQRVLTSGPAAGQPLLFPNLVLNAAAGYAAIELGIQGPNVCVAEHEASGEAALATAFDLLAGGACDVVCAAGVDELGAVQLEALADLRLLHPDALPEERRAAARRAGRGASGALLPGEGAAALVIERGSHAQARSAGGYATLAAARVGGAPASTYGLPRDAAAAVERILELAQADPAAIGGLIGGANGLPARDALDAAILERLEGSSRRTVGYAPFKRLCGEWGASGALAAALGALALDARRLPVPAGFEDPSAWTAIDTPDQLLLVGIARGGVLAPVLLERATGAARCSSTASTSSSS